MAILLAETLITLGAAAQRWRQGQEAWVPFTDAIALLRAVVIVVGVGVIKPFLTPAPFELAWIYLFYPAPFTT
jgi:hypothetical protein